MDDHPIDRVQLAIRTALEEDIGDGDATTFSTIPDNLLLHGSFLAKAEGVISGLEIARAVFRMLDPDTDFNSRIQDGATVAPGQQFAELATSGRALLTGERTALNFLQRMSGIATITRAFVQAVVGTKTVILDTRKTAPGLRYFDKLAVRHGGGTNHRSGLFDMVLIKDNHIDAAGGLGPAVERFRAGRYAKLPVEVECRSLSDVETAVALKVDRLMLDNMDIPTITKAVRLVAGRVPLEVSGNVGLDNVRAYAETGVEFISVGALTHSVKALDISLKVQRSNES